RKCSGTWKNVPRNTCSGFITCRGTTKQNQARHCGTPCVTSTIQVLIPCDGYDVRGPAWRAILIPTGSVMSKCSLTSRKKRPSFGATVVFCIFKPFREDQYRRDWKSRNIRSSIIGIFLFLTPRG